MAKSKANRNGIEFEVGQGVCWGAGTDLDCGTIVKISAAGTTIWVVEDEAVLLNGARSGAADALTFTPGGFVGHTSGEQRWEFKPGTGAPQRFTLRATGEFKLSGTSIHGSMRGWGNLSAGRAKHYDFNF